MAALSPTGPLPWTRTVSPSAMPPRSTAWNPVGSPQPPPMNAIGSSPSGRGTIRTPGRISMRSAQPPSSPSLALVVMPYTRRCGQRVAARATVQCQHAPHTPNTS
jgi:hypothetical protein